MRYAGIKENDIVDGEGICVSFWVQGCHHLCEGCHNPTTWSFTGGRELPETYKEDIYTLLNKNGIPRNLSVLGGEPLCEENVGIVYDLIKYVKEKEVSKKVYVWTGYLYEEIKSKYPYILEYVDVLIDGKFVLNKRDITLFLRGSSNQRVIDVQKSLKDNKVIIYHE